MQNIKKFNKKMVAIGLAAAMLAGILGGCQSNGKDADTDTNASVSNYNAGDEAHLFLSDGKLQLLTDLKEDEPRQVDVQNVSEEQEIIFSPDKKYAYFLEEVEDGKGTLCRLDIKANEVTRIDTKVLPTVQCTVGGTVLYQNSALKLFRYDGEESVTIAAKANYFWVDEEQRLIYLEYGNSGNILYSMDLKKDEQAKELTKGCTELVSSKDFDDLVYMKEDENGFSLYAVGVDSGVKKIADTILHYFDSADGSVYFVTEQEFTQPLYDYVVDTDFEKEYGATEPNLEDYERKLYFYQDAYQNYDLTENMQLYTTCSDIQYFFNESMQDVMERFSGDPAYDNVAAFVEKYIGREDWQGYFPVDEEVKNDLIEICNTHGLGEEAIVEGEELAYVEQEWLQFCFFRGEEETDYDYDKFYEDCDAYEKIALRNALRDELKEQKISKNTLCVYRNGEQSVINELAMEVNNYDNCVAYNSSEHLIGSMNVKDLEYAFEVESVLIPEDLADEYLVDKQSGEVYTISEEARKNMNELFADNEFILQIDKDLVGLWCTNGIYYTAEVKDGTISAFTQKAENVFWNENVVFEDGAWTFERENGKETELVQMNIKGEIKVLGKNISGFTPISEESVMFLDGQKLCVKTGEKTETIAEQVDCFWSRKQLEEQE